METIRQARLRQSEQLTGLQSDAKDLRIAIEKAEREIHGLAGADDAHSLSRLAVLHDRVARERSRLAEVTTEIESDALGGLNEEALVKALRDFDGIWNALRGEERVRLVHLLVQRVDYNAESGEVFIHFRSSGLNSFILQQR